MEGRDGITTSPAPTTVNTVEFQMHVLDVSASDAEVRRIMALSETIFPPDPDAPSTDHNSFVYWRRRLAGDPRARILYVTRPKSAELDRPLGFFFCFPRTQEMLGFETLHVWLAGVLEEVRGMGVFPMLLARTAEHARACGYGYLTVATIPARFEKMFRILQANGWEVIGWRDAAFGRSVVLKLKL